MADHDTTATTLISEAHKLIELLLRYFASGAIAVAAFGVIQGRNFDFLRAGSSSPDVSGWIVLLFVASIGTGIYTVHQAVLFRLAHLLLFSLLGLFLKPRRGPIKLANELRGIRLKLREARDPWAKILDSWSAECHFLYCSAWGVLLAVLLARVAGIPWGMASEVSLVMGIALLIAAMVHDGAAVFKHLER